MALTSLSTISLCPTWTPSAPQANAMSMLSFTTKGTWYFFASCAKSLASSRNVASSSSFSRICRKVAPAASTSSVTSWSVLPFSHARSVMAYTFMDSFVAFSANSNSSSLVRFCNVSASVKLIWSTRWVRNVRVPAPCASVFSLAISPLTPIRDTAHTVASRICSGLPPQKAPNRAVSIQPLPVIRLIIASPFLRANTRSADAMMSMTPEMAMTAPVFRASSLAIYPKAL